LVFNTEKLTEEKLKDSFQITRQACQDFGFGYFLKEKKNVSGCVPGLLGWRQIIVFAKMAFVTKKNVYFVTYRLQKKLQILNLKKKCKNNFKKYKLLSTMILNDVQSK
jgi:hypothetical protein